MRAAFYALCLTGWVLGGATGASAQQCLQWGETTELSGFMIEGVYPGAPEFSSVSRGDLKLDAVLLHLGQPICIDGEDELADGPIAGTDLLQLACGKQKMRPGELVTMTGRIMPRHTAYHVTPALLACD